MNFWVITLLTYFSLLGAGITFAFILMDLFARI